MKLDGFISLCEAMNVIDRQLDSLTHSIILDYRIAYSFFARSSESLCDAQCQKSPSLQEIFNFQVKMKTLERVLRYKQKSEYLGFVDEEVESLDDKLTREINSMSLAN